MTTFVIGFVFLSGWQEIKTKNFGRIYATLSSNFSKHSPNHSLIAKEPKQRQILCAYFIQISEIITFQNYKQLKSSQKKIFLFLLKILSIYKQFDFKGNFTFPFIMIFSTSLTAMDVPVAQTVSFLDFTPLIINVLTLLTFFTCSIVYFFYLLIRSK